MLLLLVSARAMFQTSFSHRTSCVFVRGGGGRGEALQSWKGLQLLGCLQLAVGTASADLQSGAEGLTLYGVCPSQAQLETLRAVDDQVQELAWAWYLYEN